MMILIWNKIVFKNVKEDFISKATALYENIIEEEINTNKNFEIDNDSNSKKCFSFEEFNLIKKSQNFDFNTDFLYNSNSFLSFLSQCSDNNETINENNFHIQPKFSNKLNLIYNTNSVFNKTDSFKNIENIFNEHELKKETIFSSTCKSSCLLL